MRFVFASLIIVACTRPPAEQPQPRGLLLERVTLDTWHGAERGASGTAARATLTPQGFFAEDIELKTSTGVTLRAGLMDGAMDMRRIAAADGMAVKTWDGCAGSTRGRVDYYEGIIRTEGAISGGGCGFQLDGTKLVYNVVERRAEVFGPVRTRIEAVSADADRQAVPVIGLMLFGALLSRPVEITADKLEVLDREHKAIYRGHAKAVRDTTTMTCDTLTVFYSDTREVVRIEADGSVEAIDGDRHAWGDHADFDNATGVLKVTGSPHAQSGERKVTGDEITFTTGIDRLEVTKPKTTDQQIVIDADRLVLDADRKVATWEGHVKAKKATTLLNAPTLLARYDDKGTITRVEARGGVVVVDKDRWAKGARADYDAAAGRLVVTGKPEARQGNNRITGRSVTFVSGSDTLEVEDAKSIIDVKEKPKK